MKKGFDEGIAIKKGNESTVDCMYRSVPSKGAASPPHYHNYVELLYGIDCDMEIQVNDKTFEFKTDDIAVINPRQTHTLYSISSKSEYIVIKFMIDILQYEGQMPSETTYLLPIMHGSSNGGHIIKNVTRYDKNIKNIVYGIYEEWTSEDFGYELAVRSGITNLFLQIIRYWNKEKKYENLYIKPDDTAEIIYKAAEYSAQHYNDITAKKIADKYSLSYAYFCRSFKKIMGRSFSQYINDIRINHANRMLLTTNANMTKIAAETGFSSASHFIHNFKEKMGCSPLQYKTKIREKFGS